MTVKDFAKYVIDNMSRASLANSLNIATKLDNPEYYSFIEFLNEIVLYVNELLKEHHQIEWVQAMNNIKNRAEEIVLNEIIYV